MKWSRQFEGWRMKHRRLYLTYLVTTLAWDIYTLVAYLKAVRRDLR